MNYANLTKAKEILPGNPSLKMLQLLFFIEENEGTTVTKLAKHFEVSRSTAEAWSYALNETGRGNTSGLGVVEFKGLDMSGPRRKPRKLILTKRGKEVVGLLRGAVN